MVILIININLIVIGCKLISSFSRMDLDCFKIVIKILFESRILYEQKTKWLGLVNLNNSGVGNNIDLEFVINEKLNGTLILIELKQRYLDLEKILGWTFFYPFKYEERSDCNWKLPFYTPPIKKTVSIYTEKEILPNSFIYIRTGFSFKKNLASYLETIQHNSMKNELQFYKKWEKKETKKKDKVKQMMDIFQEDIQMVKDYMDKEKDLLKRILEEEEALTKKMLEELMLKMENKKIELTNPIIERINELKQLLQMSKEDKEIEIANTYKNQGLKVTINFLENFFITKPVKVYLNIWVDGNIDMDLLSNFTKYNTPNIEDYANDKEIKESIKNNENFDIQIDEIFYVMKNFKPELMDGKRVILEFKVYKILSGGHFENNTEKKYLDDYIPVLKKEIIGSTFFELKYENHDLNVGRYKYYLYKSLTKEKPPFQKKEKTERLISFTIENFEFGEEDLENLVFRYRNIKKKKIIDNITDKRPFIENLKNQYDNKAFEKGAGIDFYIDGGRHFPNSISVSKILLRVVDSDLRDVITPISQIGRMESSIYNPIFNLRKELRLPFYDPTLMIMITIYTIDARLGNDSQVFTIGFCFIPLFLEIKSKEQPEKRDEKRFILNVGSYQLPIYCQEYFLSKPFLYKNQIQLDRLPCSSLLVRILPAKKDENNIKLLSIKDFPKDKWEELGIVVPVPKYNEGKYNTSYFRVNESEIELFNHFRKRENTLILDKSIEIILKSKKYKDILNKDISDEKLILEIYNVLENLMTTKNDIPFMDLKYLTIYNPDVGLKFAIDGLHNLKKKSLFVCIFCIFPPGTLYTEDIDNLQIYFNSALDWESPITSPKYIEGYLKFKDIKFEKNKCLIIDIREIKFIKGKISINEYAWTIAPLFTYDGYVNSGVYQIPLFKGSVKRVVLKELKTSKDPWKTMLGLVGKKSEFYNKNILEFLKPSSVVLRILDGHREGHYKKSFDYRRISYDYIEEKDFYDYAYNEVVAEDLEGVKKLKSLLPKGLNGFRTKQKITDAIVEALGLTQFSDLENL